MGLFWGLDCQQVFPNLLKMNQASILVEPKAQPKMNEAFSRERHRFIVGTSFLSKDPLGVRDVGQGLSFSPAIEPIGAASPHTKTHGR